jgi:hypothetical protein
MSMNKRIWGVIIIVVSILLLAVIIYFAFFYKGSLSLPLVGQPAGPEPVAVAPEQTEPALGLASTALPKKAVVQTDDLTRMAAAFAERFGSFSNQSNYGNLRDLQIFMTARMKSWSQSYIESARARKTEVAIYYGITTKAILSQVKQFDEQAGQAEILVKTQRRESSGVSANGASFYQDIVIKYLREAGIWRVDEATWQNK